MEDGAHVEGRRRAHVEDGAHVEGRRRAHVEDGRTWREGGGGEHRRRRRRARSAGGPSRGERGSGTRTSDRGNGDVLRVGYGAPGAAGTSVHCSSVKSRGDDRRRDIRIECGNTW